MPIRCSQQRAAPGTQTHPNENNLHDAKSQKEPRESAETRAAGCGKKGGSAEVGEASCTPGSAASARSPGCPQMRRKARTMPHGLIEGAPGQMRGNWKCLTQVTDHWRRACTSSGVSQGHVATQRLLKDGRCGTRQRVMSAAPIALCDTAVCEFANLQMLQIASERRDVALIHMASSHVEPRDCHPAVVSVFIYPYEFCSSETICKN